MKTKLVILIFFLTTTLITNFTSISSAKVDKIKRLHKGINGLQKPFERNQPQIKQIFEWNKKVIVEAGGIFYKLDINTATAKPIFCPGDRQLVSLTSKGEQDLALCKDLRGYYLFSYSGKDWDILNTPKDLNLLTYSSIFIADKHSMVFLSEKFIFKKSDSDWEKISISQAFKSFSNLLAERYLLFENNLYIGHDKGEWGGGLVCLDITTGKSKIISEQKEESLGTPIRDLKIDPSGKLWIVEGLAHLGISNGTISMYDGEKVEIFASNTFHNKGNFVNWPFEATAFDCLSFSNQIPYLLTGSLGLLEYKNRKWKRLTLNWPNFTNVSSLYMLNKDTAIIGLYDAGVLIWHRGSNNFKRITLAESFYYWN